MTHDEPRARVSTIVYLATLVGLSLFLLNIFARPVERVRSGMNGYYRIAFLDMVHGTAHKPFVYRTLLPTTVRIVAAITPVGMRERFDEEVGRAAGFAFDRLGWERSSAYGTASPCC